MGIIIGHGTDKIKTSNGEEEWKIGEKVHSSKNVAFVGRSEGDAARFSIDTRKLEPYSL